MTTQIHESPETKKERSQKRFRIEMRMKIKKKMDELRQLGTRVNQSGLSGSVFHRDWCSNVFDETRKAVDRMNEVTKLK